MAFERSVMLPDAIRNPIIYLNFAIYCWRTKRFELANANLSNFYDLTNSMNIRHEVSSSTPHFFSLRQLLNEFAFSFGQQFKLIADKLKKCLPQTTANDADNGNSDGAIIHTHADGAGEAMAEYDPNADLV